MASICASVVQGALGAEFKEKFAAQNFVVADYINYGARHLLAKEPIDQAGPTQGQAHPRDPEPAAHRTLVAFGANPTAIPIPETYNALETGVVDAMDLTKSAYAASSS